MVTRCIQDIDPDVMDRLVFYAVRRRKDDYRVLVADYGSECGAHRWLIYDPFVRGNEPVLIGERIELELYTTDEMKGSYESFRDLDGSPVRVSSNGVNLILRSIRSRVLGEI